MELNIVNDVATLKRLSIGQLRQRFAEVFGEATTASNRTWLVKRIIWRLQALAEGDLSERARRRAEELARDADLRLNAPKGKTTRPPRNRPTHDRNRRPYMLRSIRVCHPQAPFSLAHTRASDCKVDI